MTPDENGHLSDRVTRFQSQVAPIDHAHADVPQGLPEHVHVVEQLTGWLSFVLPGAFGDQERLETPNKWSVPRLLPVAGSPRFLTLLQRSPPNGRPKRSARAAPHGLNHPGLALKRPSSDLGTAILDTDLWFLCKVNPAIKKYECTAHPVRKSHPGWPTTTPGDAASSVTR